MRQRGRRMEKQKRKGRPQRSRVSPWVYAAAGLVVVVALGAIISVLGGGGESAQWTLSEPRQVGPIEALATRIEMGRVPLNRWVDPTFRLRNVSAEPVAINIPSQGVETLEGC